MSVSNPEELPWQRSRRRIPRVIGWTATGVWIVALVLPGFFRRADSGAYVPPAMEVGAVFTLVTSSMIMLVVFLVEALTDPRQRSGPRGLWVASHAFRLCSVTLFVVLAVDMTINWVDDRLPWLVSYLAFAALWAHVGAEFVRDRKRKRLDLARAAQPG